MPSTWPLALLVSLQFFRLLHGYSPGYNTPCDGRSIYIYLCIFLSIYAYIYLYLHIFMSHVMQSHVDNCIIFYRNSQTLRVIRAYTNTPADHTYQCSLHSLDLFSLFALSLSLLSFTNCRTVRCGIIKNAIVPSMHVLTVFFTKFDFYSSLLY